MQHVIGADPNDPIFEIDELGRLFILRPLDYRVATMHRLILRVSVSQ